MSDTRDERLRLRDADCLIEDLAAKLRENKQIIAGSLGFGRITWHGKDGKWQIDLEPKL
jgi:hypothetical protein